jgi:hypothetical protein
MASVRQELAAAVALLPGGAIQVQHDDEKRRKVEALMLPDELPPRRAPSPALAAPGGGDVAAARVERHADFNSIRHRSMAHSSMPPPAISMTASIAEGTRPITIIRSLTGVIMGVALRARARC